MTKILVGLALGLVLGACKHDDKPRPRGADPASDPAPAAALATTGVTGVAIAPVVTSSITFVVPRDAGTWAELAFPCYAAGATMSSGAAGRPGAAFEQVSPLIPAAMMAGGIDLDHDLVAIGGFECGGGPCIYFAFHLKTPEKMKDLLAMIPGAAPIDLGGGHYTVEAPGERGARTIHVRVVPVRWTGVATPDDPWGAWQARATHVVFVGGWMSGVADVDPLPLLAAPAAARAKVEATESVAADTHGRCVIGTAGASADWKPGFALDRARFVMAAPLGAGDPMSRLLDSRRSLDVEVELTLTPAPAAADVSRWVDEGRAWLAGVAAPIRAQFAGQGPMADMLIEMFAVVGERGFRSAVKGQDVTLSWRTDRVPQAALDAIERDLERAGFVP